MPGKSRLCEICGIREKQRGGFFADFPLDEIRCKSWVKVVGKEDFLHVPIEKLHELRHVCGDHFNKNDFNKKGNRLKKIHSINLSSSPLLDAQLSKFPVIVASYKVLSTDVSKNTSAISTIFNILEQPSTSEQPPCTSTCNDSAVPVSMEHILEKRSTSKQINLFAQPSTSERPPCTSL